MPEKSYQQWWIDFFRRNESSYREMVKDDPFEDWEQNRTPQVNAECHFQSARFIRLADTATTLARKFAKHAVDVGERALAEDKVSRTYDSVEWNRAMCVADVVFSKALLRGKFDAKRLRQAVPDLEDACRRIRKETWDDVNQAKHLEAVRLALLADDVDAANRILTAKKTYKYHAEEHKLWLRLMKLPRGQYPIENVTFAKSLNRYFEKVRNPDYDPDVYISEFRLRFELGLLVEKLLHSQGDIDVNSVLDRIRR